MGQIKRQSIKGTFYSYIGAVIGFLTTGLLFPKFLSTEQVGLITMLASYASLFAVFGNLGFNSVIIRLFPYFRDDKNKNNGFFFLTAVVSALGFILAIVLYFILKPVIIKDNIAHSYFFVQYLYLIPPLIFFLLVFSIYDSYNRALFNATYGTFLIEIFQRFTILIVILLFITGLASFNQFIILYVISLSIPGILIFYPIIKNKQISFKPDLGFIKRDLRREIIGVSTFGIILGYSNIIIQRIDMIMINSMISLSASGIYSIPLLFGGIVSLPSRSLTRISTSVVADAWKQNDMETIRSVYYKSCLNQTIMGGLVLAGIWANINNVFHILPPDYAEGKYVILFFGLSSLITMMTGANCVILNLSKHYRANTYFILVFGLLIIVSNLLLIPHFGITGAALASTISTFIYNLITIIYLYIKYKLFPYDMKIVLAIFISVVTYLFSLLIPELSNYILDIVVRSSLMTIVFIVLIVASKAFPDVDSIKMVVINKLKSIFR